MRTPILALVALLTLPPALAAQVPQVPRGGANPDVERANRHYAAGWSAMHSEAWAEAVKEFQQTIDIEPKFTLAYYSLGRAEMGLRHFPKAIDAYTKCRELYVAGGGEHFTNQLDGTKRLDDQILELTVAKTAAQQAGAKSNMQSQQLYLRELTNKINQLEQARDSNRNLTIDATVPYFVPMALGAAYFRSGKLEDAEREYKTAIEANSASGETHSNLAVLYMTTGRLEEATSEVKLAEKTGFRVNPQFKQDLEARRKGKL